MIHLKVDIYSLEMDFAIYLDHVYVFQDLYFHVQAYP